MKISIGILALLSAGLAIGGPLPLPSNLFLPGSGDVSTDAEGFFGQSICEFPTRSLPNATTCTMNTSNGINGSAGTATAYTDGYGMHVFTEAMAAGDAHTYSDAQASILDSVYNAGSIPIDLSANVNLHATIAGIPDGASYFELTYSYSPQVLIRASTVNSGLVGYNLSFTTPVIVIDPGQTAFWIMSLIGHSSTSQGDTYMDAIDTLSIQSFDVTDTNGIPTDPSVLQSSNGFNYAATASSVPEPATLPLTLLVCAGIWRCRKIRRRIDNDLGVFYEGRKGFHLSKRHRHRTAFPFRR